jgi:hypothetical protein
MFKLMITLEAWHRIIEREPQIFRANSKLGKFIRKQILIRITKPKH